MPEPGDCERGDRVRRFINDLPETVLEEADRIINGPRRDSFGHPLDDFTRTGRMWAAILGIPDIPAETVGHMMTCLKISRDIHRPGRDNLVDGAGYQGRVELIRQERDRRSP